MTEHGERIAALETQVEAVEERTREILASLSRVEHELTRYKGFLGGIAFLLSGAMVMLGFLKGWMFGK